MQLHIMSCMEQRTTSGRPSSAAVRAFATATEVRPNGSDRWHAALPTTWDIAGAVNGGVLLATAGRALLAATGRSDPVTVTGHFLSPVGPGSVDIATDVLKRGRRFTTGRAVLGAAGRPVLTVLGTFGRLEPDAEVLLTDGGPPPMPPPEACVHLEATETFPPPFFAHVDIRLRPEDATFLGGRPSGRTEMHAWLRLPDDEPINTIGLLCLVDALPPTIFNADFPIRWTPTMELTTHVRARPAPGWLRSSAITRFISGGFLEIDVEIWDSADRLVAQARQLALVPQPENAPHVDRPSGHAGAAT